MTANPASLTRTTGWDRVVIIILGGAGCALSYDALQQTATAIHVRGQLTYLFPLVIDGFIGYGVRALLVLRSSDLAARCYVWALFGTATATSVWANALRAVRLNGPGHRGLHLGNTAVGVLSTVAPLALAGAVHLYILIARREAASAGHAPVGVPTTTDHRLRSAPEQHTARSEASAGDNDRDTVRQGLARTVLGHGSPGQADRAQDTRRFWDRALRRSECSPLRRPQVTSPTAARSQGSAENLPGVGTVDVPDTAAIPDQQLFIARDAVTRSGKLTRAVVASAIRGRGQPLSNARLTELMQQLRSERQSDRTTRVA